MFQFTDRLLVQARLDELRREAEAAHLARAARLARGAHRARAERAGRSSRRRSFRRTLGRQLMRAGARLAADPSRRPARQI